MMQHIMRSPITDKETAVSINEKFYVASSSVQGWRVYMEDAHTVLLQSPIDDDDCVFFGVYDGHGGSKVANFASKNLHTKILNHNSYATGDINTAIQEGYLSLDLDVQRNATLFGGSTALVVIIKGTALYCANAGDSRAIAYVGNSTISLSEDHKPTSPLEFMRIKNAGFSVRLDRINGELAVSRGFGDFKYKRNTEIPPSLQAVSCIPDVRCEDITPDWKFLILASDGVYDVFSTEELGSYVKTRMDCGIRPEVIVQRLLDNCMSTFRYENAIHDKGSDNMTIILIILRNHVNEKYTEVLKKPPASKYLTSCAKPQPDIGSEAGPSGTSIRSNKRTV